MKKKLIEVNYDKISDGDIAVFQYGRWIVIPRIVFLNDIYEKLQELNSKIEQEIENRIASDNNINDAVNHLDNVIKYDLLGETPEPEEQNNEEEQNA